MEVLEGILWNKFSFFFTCKVINVKSMQIQASDVMFHPFLAKSNPLNTCKTFYKTDEKNMENKSTHMFTPKTPLNQQK